MDTLDDLINFMQDQKDTATVSNEKTAISNFVNCLHILKREGTQESFLSAVSPTGYKMISGLLNAYTADTKKSPVKLILDHEDLGASYTIKVELV